MNIKVLTPMSAVDKYIQDRINKKEEEIIRIFNRAGIDGVNKARADGEYTDRTGNLRSSTGYLIARDGKVLVKSDFETVRDTADKGPKQGEDFLFEILKTYKTGIVLIMVAGMEYAAAVEARNYDVLSNASLLAEKTLKRLLSRIK